MSTIKQICRSFVKRHKLALILSASSVLTGALIGCATPQAIPMQSSTTPATQSTSLPPLICTEDRPIQYQPGKPNPSLADITKAMGNADDLRALLGDNSGTIQQVQSHNAKWHKLCPGQ